MTDKMRLTYEVIFKKEAWVKSIEEFSKKISDRQTFARGYINSRKDYFKHIIEIAEREGMIDRITREFWLDNKDAWIVLYKLEELARATYDKRFPVGESYRIPESYVTKRG